MYMKRTLVFVSVLVVLLLGCAGTYPTTIAGAREAMVQSSWSDRDTFEVRRPFTAVARTLKRKAAECLNGKVTTTIRPNIGFGQTTRHEQHKATVVISKDKAELGFQVLGHGIPNQPPGGIFYLVADAYPVGKNRTKVDIVRGRVEVVAQAIKLWAAGNDRGCPDPAKVFPR